MAKSIGELIPNIVRQAATKHNTIQRLQRAWPRLVGKALAAHTRPGRLRRKTLYVYTDEPGASFLLNLENPRLLEKVQTRTGYDIEEIVIRPE